MCARRTTSQTIASRSQPLAAWEAPCAKESGKKATVLVGDGAGEGSSFSLNHPRAGAGGGSGWRNGEIGPSREKAALSSSLRLPWAQCRLCLGHDPQALTADNRSQGGERGLRGPAGRVHCTVNSEAWRSGPEDPNLLSVPYHTFFPNHPAPHGKLSRLSTTPRPICHHFTTK